MDVIFIHGLTGDPHHTWTDKEGNSFWPEWLQQDLERLRIYSLGYPVSLFERLANREMDMFERAANVLEFLSSSGIGKKPIVFVTHSLGGIVTKLVLRKSQDSEDDDWRRVFQATKMVIYFSTPHTGASLARAIKAIPNISKHVKLLANETGFLSDLNDYYRKLANNRDDFNTVVYYEKYPTKNAKIIVKKDEADPGVSGCIPVPIDKDHINICKPQNREDIVYLGIKRHIQRVLKSAERVESNQDKFVIGPDDYSEKSPRDRRDLFNKLIEAGKEHEYGYANDSQNQFARQFTQTGLFTAAREDHSNLLSEVETRFVTHVYHPLICGSGTDEEIRTAIQEKVIDALSSKRIGGTRFNAKLILCALYYLTEQCYIRWDSSS